ncbi:hypothetical protein LEP1GSC066_1349 [Leptospira sp. serovar Kenya str. Sh9]|nr:hypothetical protein LEP1GSC066_1349 [Leptospira sp. serovar Kenya str. Sh9]
MASRVNPTSVTSFRLNENLVVSCKIKTGPLSKLYLSCVNQKMAS